MANTLELGNGKWATGKDTVLAFNDQNNNFKPLPFSFSRDTSGTVVNKDGLIETVGSGEPRIDFKDNTKGALKLEPQRTNLITYSEDFTQWTNTRSSDSNGFVSPTGGTNATKLISDNTASSSHIIKSSNFTLLSGQKYTYSVFVKANQLNYVRLMFTDGAVSKYLSVFFNLTDGTIGTTSDGGSATLDSSNIENFGNGWFRCSVSGDLDTITTAHARIYLAEADNDFTIDGDGVSGIYIYGAQFEQGSYATSYIPTSGQANGVTRVADSSSQTPPDGVIGQTEGTVFLDFIYNNNAANTRIFSITGNSWISNGSIRLEKSGIHFKWNWVNNGGASGSLTSTSFMVVGQRYKMAITYNSTSASLFIYGVKEDTSSVTTPTSINKIHLNELGGGFSDIYEFQKNNFNQVLLYNTELTDQEAIALTQ
jgi:hypothetical protein